MALSTLENKLYPSLSGFKKWTSSLLRFAHKTSKNRPQGDFLPCKLPKQPRKNLQAQQAASRLTGLNVLIKTTEFRGV
jgi:hypothetical protein